MGERETKLGSESLLCTRRIGSAVDTASLVSDAAASACSNTLARHNVGETI